MSVGRDEPPRHVRLRLLIAGLLLAAGAIVVALPDSGDRLVSLSDAHGPSALDAVGIVLLLAGWVAAVREVWRRREKVLESTAAGVVRLGLVALGFGAGLVVASAFADFGAWWAVGAAVLALVQLAALVVALR